MVLAVVMGAITHHASSTHQQCASIAVEVIYRVVDLTRPGGGWVVIFVRLMRSFHSAPLISHSSSARTHLIPEAHSLPLAVGVATVHTVSGTAEAVM